MTPNIEMEMTQNYQNTSIQMKLPLNDVQKIINNDRIHSTLEIPHHQIVTK